MNKVDTVFEQLDEMSALDLMQLKKKIESEWGVTSVAFIPPGGPPGDIGGGLGDDEEKSEFDLYLSDIGEKKINVIKIVRLLTGLGLKEAKDLVDKSALEPQLVREGVRKDDVAALEQQFSEAGATVEAR